MKLKYKIYLYLYQFFRSLRYALLKSVFGITIHCKHSPTCGTYAFNKIKDEGFIKGGVKGFKRVIKCW